MTFVSPYIYTVIVILYTYPVTEKWKNCGEELAEMHRRNRTVTEAVGSLTRRVVTFLRR